MVIEFNNHFLHSKALPNLPKLGTWVWKYTILQPWPKVNDQFDNLGIMAQVLVLDPSYALVINANAGWDHYLQ
jgi:hypothetical protein